MEFRDYLSLAAIIISLASFGFAIWGAQFSRRTKLSELRAAVLVKAAELSNRLARVYDLHVEMRQHAERIGDVKGLEIIGSEDIERIQSKADFAYQRLSSWPSSRGLDAYEAFYHELHDLNDQVAALEQSRKSHRDRYLAITKAPSTGSN